MASCQNHVTLVYLMFSRDVILIDICPRPCEYIATHVFAYGAKLLIVGTPNLNLNILKFSKVIRYIVSKNSAL